ncbi:hypothetical protein CPB85DRAFT_778 [Mucidula mucida]|nr:hypothetical protein CPB85DRAFT_778 [Mucidula mucida]
MYRKVPSHGVWLLYLISRTVTWRFQLLDTVTISFVNRDVFSLEVDLHRSLQDSGCSWQVSVQGIIVTSCGYYHAMAIMICAINGVHTSFD